MNQTLDQPTKENSEGDGHEMGLWNYGSYPWYKGMGAYSVMKGWDWFGWYE